MISTFLLIYSFIYLFIYLRNFYRDNEKAKEKIDTIRDSTTEQGSKLSAPGWLTLADASSVSPSSEQLRGYR